MDKLKVLDLFSGIGGFSLGLERTGGFETVAFCEIEEYPRRVLAKHWPNVPCFEDVRKLKRGDIDGPIDVTCGGYPCQPFSHAGRRKGAEDDRHLWPEVSRLLDEFRPTWFIGENVAGHISMGLDEVLSDLEGKGYTARPFVIPACAVNAPHRRDRVWIVGNADENDADATSIGQQGSRRSKQQKCAKSDRKKETTDFKYVRGWPTEPDVGRVAHGVPSRVDRLKALGNAVVPQIPEMIGYAILEAEKDK